MGRLNLQKIIVYKRKGDKVAKGEKMKNEKMYKIFYGDNEGDYIRSYLKDDEIINGYLTEAKAFDIFFSDMILCNNYIKNNYKNLDELISAYNEEEDYYEDEFQVFIVNIEYDEDTTKKAIEKMGNTFYYDNENNIYLTGITDFGTSRTIVSTDLKVEEVKEG